MLTSVFIQIIEGSVTLWNLMLFTWNHWNHSCKMKSKMELKSPSSNLCYYLILENDMYCGFILDHMIPTIPVMNLWVQVLQQKALTVTTDTSNVVAMEPAKLA